MLQAVCSTLFPEEGRARRCLPFPRPHPPAALHFTIHFKSGVRRSREGHYLDALANVDDSTPLRNILDQVSRPTTYRRRRARALRIGDPHDIALLQAISNGKFAVSGFRNRDLRSSLLSEAKPADSRRLSARITRLLRLLPAHRLIRKLPRSHRYRLTQKGALLSAALFAVRDASLKQLIAKAA